MATIGSPQSFNLNLHSRSTLIGAALAFLAIVTAINLFWHLGDSKVMEWDEARRGVAAFEMLKTGEVIVNSYRDVPDYWSTKPPLGLWGMTASYYLLGPSRFALRLPSVIFSLLTLLVLTLFSWRRYGSMAAFIAAAILITTPPFILDHLSRAGEYDSLLVLLSTTGIFAVVAGYSAILIGLIFGGIFLTKSFAVVIPLGQLAMAGLFSDEIKFRWKKIVITAFTASLVILLWIALRYSSDGVKFFQAMWSNDAHARTMGAIEGHGRPWYWYITRLIAKDPFWTSILIGLAVFYFFRRSGSAAEIVRKHALLLTWIAAPLLICTAIPTKISWYVAMVYPALAVTTGVLVNKFRSQFPRAALCLFFGAFIGSESFVIHGILAQAKRPAYESLIEELSHAQGATIGSTTWGQAAYFIARVENGMLPRDVPISEQTGAHCATDFILENEANILPRPSYELIVQKEEWAVFGCKSDQIQAKLK